MAAADLAAIASLHPSTVRKTEIHHSFKWHEGPFNLNKCKVKIGASFYQDHKALIRAKEVRYRSQTDPLTNTYQCCIKVSTDHWVECDWCSLTTQDLIYDLELNCTVHARQTTTHFDEKIAPVIPAIEQSKFMILLKFAQLNLFNKK